MAWVTFGLLLEEKAEEKLYVGNSKGSRRFPPETTQLPKTKAVLFPWFFTLPPSSLVYLGAWVSPGLDRVEKLSPACHGQLLRFYQSRKLSERSKCFWSRFPFLTRTEIAVGPKLNSGEEGRCSVQISDQPKPTSKTGVTPPSNLTVPVPLCNGGTGSQSLPTPRPEGKASSVKSFTFNELKNATRNFRPDSFLGEGGFGCVFKGWIDVQTLSAAKPGSGMVVAVKRLKPEGFQGHKEWLAEVNYLGQLRHPNLVKLIGYCCEGDNRLLVYEFMPRGCLDNHLFRSAKLSHCHQGGKCTSLSMSKFTPGTKDHLTNLFDNLLAFHGIGGSSMWISILAEDGRQTETIRGSGGPQPLAWATRIKVAVGAAKGLSFLHDSESQVIYRDVKASNILLDGDFSAKLSDFGLAKDGPKGDRTHVSTQVMGTQGYAAPEYIATGRLSVKSDVYSFGVVLLELLTGRLALDKSKAGVEQNLVEWTRPYLGDKRKLFRIMDTRLEGQYPQKGAHAVATLAVQCLNSEAKERPQMAEVLTALEQIQASKDTARCNQTQHRVRITVYMAAWIDDPDDPEAKRSMLFL
ncbi:hypothetical protein ACLOJK_013081 [Asimina triloba]